MKSRRVVVTLELETTETVSDLRRKEAWDYICTEADVGRVIQVQANVVKSPRKK